MNFVRCDVCETTNEKWVHPPLRWRTLDIRKAKDWYPRSVSLGGNMFGDAEDAWPGSGRWNGVWSDALRLHVCSEDCAFQALAKLHDGSEVIAFSGFGVDTAAFLGMIRERVALSPDGETERS